MPQIERHRPAVRPLGGNGTLFLASAVAAAVVAFAFAAAAGVSFGAAVAAAVAAAAVAAAAAAVAAVAAAAAAAACDCRRCFLPCLSVWCGLSSEAAVGILGSDGAALSITG